MSGAQEEYYNRERRDGYHSLNLSGGERQAGESAEILRYLSQIDDLPIDPTSDQVMGQLVSTLTSTANLTADQVMSNEWVREYILVLYLAIKPTKEGLHGSDRAWAHGDASADIDALDTQDRAMLEALVMNSKLALTRSEDFTGPKEATRNVSESVVHDEASKNGGSGGILGRLRG